MINKKKFSTYSLLKAAKSHMVFSIWFHLQNNLENQSQGFFEDVIKLQILSEIQLPFLFPFF